MSGPWVPAYCFITMARAGRASRVGWSSPTSLLASGQARLATCWLWGTPDLSLRVAPARSRSLTERPGRASRSGRYRASAPYGGAPPLTFGSSAIPGLCFTARRPGDDDAEISTARSKERDPKSQRHRSEGIVTALRPYRARILLQPTGLYHDATQICRSVVSKLWYMLFSDLGSRSLDLGVSDLG